MDGSRLLNAAVGLGVSVKELASDVDSVSFCFSKVLLSICVLNVHVCIISCVLIDLEATSRMFLLG